jgi:hypothetical protein
MTVEMVDFYWENLVFAAIGEVLDDSDEICGCRVVDKSKKGNSRTLFRLELWLKSGNEVLGDKIRSKLVERLVDGDGSKGGRLKPTDFEYKRRAP